VTKFLLKSEFRLTELQWNDDAVKSGWRRTMRAVIVAVLVALLGVRHAGSQSHGIQSLSVSAVCCQ